MSLGTSGGKATVKVRVMADSSTVEESLTNRTRP